MPTSLEGRILALTAAVHLLLGLVALVYLRADVPLIGGAHPALKPMKFGISIALFLGTMAVVVPMLTTSASVRVGLAATLSLTMVAEMIAIVTQALRGRASHFNMSTAGDNAWWKLMMVAIVVATIAMIAVATLASIAPLRDRATGGTLDALRATAWRAGCWLVILAAASGFAMGGRSRHSIGGDDAGPGIALLGWSRTHGDLRVPHFIALHVLQAVPLAGAILQRLPLPPALRWIGLAVVLLASAALCVLSLVSAFAGRPLLR